MICTGRQMNCGPDSRRGWADLAAAFRASPPGVGAFANPAFMLVGGQLLELALLATREDYARRPARPARPSPERLD